MGVRILVCCMTVALQQTGFVYVIVVAAVAGLHSAAVAVAVAVAVVEGAETLLKTCSLYLSDVKSD